MLRFKLYFILLIAALTIYSCSSSNTVAPPRDRVQQYAEDIDSIEIYLKSHYITDVTVNGQPDITINKITDSTKQVSIWKDTKYPLQHKIVKNDNRTTNKVDGINVNDTVVQYKLYYLVINKGGGQAPSTVDSTFTSYEGRTLNDKIFDARDIPLWSTFPAINAGESAFISGYRQFLPELKTAIGSAVGDDGSVSFANGGLGVVFIPSGLGYFDKAQLTIPAYSDLVFKIRLQSLRYRDHDRDGVSSNNELDPNKVYKYGPNPFSYDTDADNIPNFLDVDDDGDAYSTRLEIEVNGVITFPYPTCTSGIPMYLDKTCHPPAKTTP